MDLMRPPARLPALLIIVDVYLAPFTKMTTNQREENCWKSIDLLALLEQSKIELFSSTAKVIGTGTGLGTSMGTSMGMGTTNTNTTTNTSDIMSEVNSSKFQFFKLIQFSPNGQPTPTPSPKRPKRPRHPTGNGKEVELVAKLLFFFYSFSDYSVSVSDSDERCIDLDFIADLKSLETFEEISDFSLLSGTILKLAATVDAHTTNTNTTTKHSLGKDLAAILISWVNQLAAEARSDSSDSTDAKIRLASCLKGIADAAHLCWVFDGLLQDLTNPLRDLQKMLDPLGAVFLSPSSEASPSTRIAKTFASSVDIDITLVGLGDFIQAFTAISASFIQVQVMHATPMTHDFISTDNTIFVDVLWDDASRPLYASRPRSRPDGIDDHDAGYGNAADVSRMASPVATENMFDLGDVAFFREFIGLMEGLPFDTNSRMAVDLIRARVLGSLVLFYSTRFPLSDQTETIKSLLQENTKNIDFVLACLEGLAILATHDTDLIPGVVDFLTDFLLAPSHLFCSFEEEWAEIIMECAANALANLLDSPTCPHDLASSKKTRLFACINCMHASFLAVQKKQGECVDVDGVQDRENVRRFSNSVSAISHLTRVLKPKDTVDNAIPALVRRIEESSSLQPALWTALDNIGMNNDAEIFKSIISTTLSDTSTSPHVTKIAVLLARMPGRPLALLQMYLEKVLGQVQAHVVVLHKTGDLSVVPYLLHLTNLVRVLLETPHLREYVHSDYDFSQQLRNMWFCLVLYVQTAAGAWPPEWKGVLKGLARHCPAIVIDPRSRSLDVHLGSDSILVATFSESVVLKIKPLLIKYAPAMAADIRALTWPVAVFLLTVAQVESLRIKTLAVENLVGYLVDDRLQAPGLYPVAENVIDGILKAALKDSYYRTLPDSVIEGHIKALLLFAAHRISSIRSFAAKWIMNILNALPFMLFNRNIIHSMLDQLRFLDNSKIGHFEEFLDHFSSKLNFLTCLEAHESAHSFYLLCNDWVSAALKMSSAETIPILQSYISEISAVAPWIGSRQMEQTQNAVPQDDISSSFLMVLFQRFYADSATSAGMIRHSNKRVRLLGEVRGFIEGDVSANGNVGQAFRNLSRQFSKEVRAIYRDPSSPHFLALLYQVMSKCAALVLLNETVETELIMLICNAPKVNFVASVVEVTLEILSWIMSVKPDFVNRILAYLTQTWEAIAIKGLGIYSPDLRSINPFEGPMMYGTPREIPGKNWTCDSHAIWITFLLERFKFDRLQGSERLYLYSSFIRLACQEKFPMSSAFKAREARIDLCILSIKVAKELSRRGLKTALFLWTDVFEMCCSLFSKQHTYGEMDKAHFSKMILVYNTIKNLKFEKLASSLSTTLLKSAFVTYREGDRLEFSDVQQLLVLLWENEIHRFASWIKPLASDEASTGFAIPPPNDGRLIKWNIVLKTAWRINPEVAISLRSRFVNNAEMIDVELLECAKTSYIRALSCSDAVSIFLKHVSKTKSENQLRHLLYWTPVPPVTAVQILSQIQSPHPWVIQFAIRSLEDFPITQVFFYIPQLVQALRSDSMGYIEKYILEAAKSSQYFAHQIIWNMDANKFKDDSCEVADTLMPTFERIIEKIVHNLTGEDKEFYEREFSFFREITDISGKLKPLVATASKQEKKKKIDEELSKIKVDVGVYLPTNPDREVVDIDYSSGRPLQSHAKAPYMATFMVRNSGDQFSEPERMASIFKVGDDCRQDLLALQLISVFQSIFQSAGLDLYTFPYRVVATAPGCGVIEVIPQSISRDMMGREKVNSLFDWFLAEFGSENSIKFKTARSEFIKSLAAYSIIMFLLQIKDRHNGNIMFDRQGHLIHIDFGFMLSIAPGGGILEVAPFKLTSEMIQVLGGDANSPGYTLFSELCVKGYLACRLYSEEIVNIVQQMLESGLPCFKGELTIRKLRERFQLDKSERGAADFMLGCIRQSHENTRSGLYDLFQYAQNGIPYK